MKVTTVEKGKLAGIKAEDRAKIKEIKKTEKEKEINNGIGSVIKESPHLTVEEYLSRYPEADRMGKDYKVGENDILNIIVYEEPDLSKEAVRVSGEGYISFPLIGRLKVANLSTSEIEQQIAGKLAEQQYLLDAHVSVMVTEYRSKNFLVLGAVKNPGSYFLQGREHLLDALSKVEGVDPEKAGSRALLIRTLNPDESQEQKVVIKIDLRDLFKRGGQATNLLLTHKDVIYVAPVEHYYIIGQVNGPGSYAMPENEITLVEAIGMAGGFTRIASRNKTRIVRLEEGVEKIIEVKVDEITEAGKKIQDVVIKPGDVIVVPESFF
ncbi:MAG: polysaccharide biosynthesis/export family protein [Desulfobacteraceae bacterium]